MRGRLSRHISRKWRPPLVLVLGGTLAAVFALPLVGIGYFRLAGGILDWAETSWMIAWIALLSAGILGYLLWRLVLRPVKVLTGFADAVAEGQKGAQAPLHYGTPELSALGQAVIEMSATLQARETTVRSYADHVTHELKSPLTTVRGAAELLSGDLDDATRQSLVTRIAQAADQMTALIDAQRALALAREPLAKGVSTVSEVVPHIEGLDVEILSDAPLPISAEGLEMILTHLLGNAAHHGATQITLDAIESGLTVGDNGRGVSEGNRDKIFDPFFTTRRDTGGTGMGLAIVQQMLSAQGAEIALLPSEKGACFVIRF